MVHSHLGLAGVGAFGKFDMVRHPGIEPGSLPWQGSILPLDQCRLVGEKLMLMLVAFRALHQANTQWRFAKRGQRLE